VTELRPRPLWALDPECPRADRYLLGPELGRGGMGRVCLGWDDLLRRTVAIKLLLGDDPEWHVRLLREAQNQAKLVHPCICQIYDVGQAGDRPYIAMQLVHGQSLAELRPHLSRTDLVRIMADVASALHEAHFTGLIHRDLKPMNILVEGQSGELMKPFVVDFGLARDLRAPDLTLSWAVMGTPAFMSPEQARGEPMGPTSDIYSLGATLYSLLSGAPPYEGSTLGGIISQQEHTTVSPLRRLNWSIPKDLETITLKCLERDPGRRYPTAFALEEDLRRWLAGEPIQAQPISLLGQLQRWAKRKPALARTTAAGLLATVGLLVWNYNIRTAATVREQAAQRFGMEIRDAEHLLRIERMMPSHDIRPAEARLLARMEAIRKNMAQLGRPADGPGHYALGRGFLALRKYPEASRELEAAWQAGFQASEVAYGLGLALLKQYEEANLLAGAQHTPMEARQKQRSALVPPALQWLTRAGGATVDHPEYGAGLVAHAEGRFSEADQHYAKALEEAPWLYEAWIARSTNVYGNTFTDLSTSTSEQAHALVLRSEAMLQRAEQLAPSDDAVLFLRANLLTSEAILRSARNDRRRQPYLDAHRLLERALEIRPDSEQIRAFLPNTSMQLGFLMLSTGEDPAQMVRRTALRLEAFSSREAWSREQDWIVAKNTLHNLWWVVADADQRFGRSPDEALDHARRWREQVAPDPHHVFTRLLEAKVMADRGQYPGHAYSEIQAALAGLGTAPELRDSSFYLTICGQALLEQAEWEWTHRRQGAATVAKAIARLEACRTREPHFAYAYYHLPRAHALAARMALAAGQDPWPQVQAAVATARQGQAINPGNAQLQLAAADAQLAEGQARAAAGQDPTPTWAACRAALAAGERANPRDYRLALLRAVLELAAAEKSVDPAAHLRVVEAACRAGLVIKRDEPRFQQLLAQMATPKTGQP